jgi:hypothetical protein
VLKLEAELQQHQEARRDWQRQPTGDVGGEQNELPGEEVAEGDGTSADPPGERWRTPSKQVVHHIERRLGLEAVGLAKRSHGVGGGTGVEQESTNAKRHRKLERRKGVARKRECERVTAACGENPFSRKTLPLAPISPRVHQSDPASDTGTQGHKSYSWCAGLRVLRRRTATREANCRPRYCASPSSPEATTQSLTRGAGPTSHTPWASVSEYRKSEPSLAPVLRLLGAVAEDGEGNFFQTNAAVSRRLAHGPARPSCVGATGQSAAGTDVAVGVSEGGLAVSTSANARKRCANRQSSFGPTCRLISSPEAVLGATVSTLEQGYPLL